MRLLAFTAFLLLLASPSFGAPVSNEEEPRTTIETIYETVTRTVIREVTDPATAEPEPVEEGSGEGSGEQDSDAQPGETGIIGSNVAADGQTKPCPACNCNCNLPCGCAGAAAGAAAAADSASVVGTMKQCTCAETDFCRVESSKGLDECFEECDNHLEVYGTANLEKNRKCFVNNNATIVEAENCLFDKKEDYCNNGTEEKQIELVNWEDYTNFEYTAEADKTIKENALWKKHEEKYTNFQKFFHCTKHCLHKKFNTCTTEKGCAVKLPTSEQFAAKMKSCTKTNLKISAAITKTCQCLAWTNKVTDLQGACVTMGTQYFVDKA